MSILGAVGGLLVKGREFFSGLFSLIDSLHVSEEEKLRARRELLDAYAAWSEELLRYERALFEAQAAAIQAEAAGSSWIQRNWRPLTMLSFLFLILYSYFLSPVFGFPRVELPPELWSLIRIGLGGYVVGRSAEKIARTVKGK